jgi:hypothetical protein
MVRASGELNDASEPVLSAKVATPDPANVVTTPVATIILRIRLLSGSATYKLVPDESTASASGYAKDADVPVPSAKVYTPDPAKVETTFGVAEHVII